MRSLSGSRFSRDSLGPREQVGLGAGSRIGVRPATRCLKRRSTTRIRRGDSKTNVAIRFHGVQPELVITSSFSSGEELDNDKYGSGRSKIDNKPGLASIARLAVFSTTPAVEASPGRPPGTTRLTGGLPSILITSRASSAPTDIVNSRRTISRPEPLMIAT
jgi:hypothetical protein